MNTYGPIPELLQGKTKRITPANVPSTTIEHLPSYILKEHRKVTVVIDLFAVNGNYFLHTNYSKIHYRTTKAVSNRSKSAVLPIINQIIKLNSNQGFETNEVLGDNEFDCITNAISPHPSQHRCP